MVLLESHKLWVIMIKIESKFSLKALLVVPRNGFALWAIAFLSRKIPDPKVGWFKFMRSRRTCVWRKIEDSHYISMIFKKKFSKKNFKNFRPIRLRDFEILNFAPKQGSNESLLSAYSETVFRIKIDTVVREQSRFKIFKMTVFGNFFKKNWFFS